MSTLLTEIERIAVVETKVDHLRDEVASIDTKVDRLLKRDSFLDGLRGLATVVIAVAGLAIGIIGIVVRL